ncbi:hypothetical protein COCNU_scaffold001459G000040 [Cocos nucifera]|nr:hypothetical protein [Cocos nucifera]
MSRKARLGGPNGDGDEQGEDPFDNLEIIWDLTDRFTMPEVVDQMVDLDPQQLIWGSLRTILKSDHQMLIYIKSVHHQEVKAQKA